MTKPLHIVYLSYALFGEDYKHYIDGVSKCATKYPETLEILTDDLFYILKEFNRLSILPLNQQSLIQVAKFRNFLDNFYLGEWIGKEFNLKNPSSIFTIENELKVLKQFYKPEGHQECTSLRNKDGRCSYISLFHFLGSIPEIFKSKKATTPIVTSMNNKKAEYYMELYNKVVDFKIITLCQFINFAEIEYRKKIERKDPTYKKPGNFILGNMLFQNYLLKEIFKSFDLYNRPLFDLFFHSSQLHAHILLSPIAEKINISIFIAKDIEKIRFSTTKYVLAETLQFFITFGPYVTGVLLREKVFDYKLIAIYDIVTLQKDGSWVYAGSPSKTNHAVCHKICPDDGKWMSMSNTDVYKYDSFKDMIDSKVVCVPTFMLFEKI